MTANSDTIEVGIEVNLKFLFFAKLIAWFARRGPLKIIFASFLFTLGYALMESGSEMSNGSFTVPAGIFVFFLIMAGLQLFLRLVMMLLISYVQLRKSKVLARLTRSTLRLNESGVGLVPGDRSAALQFPWAAKLNAGETKRHFLFLIPFEKMSSFVFVAKNRFTVGDLQKIRTWIAQSK